LFIKGSIKSNNSNDEIFVHSIDIDCVDGSLVNLGLTFLEACKPSSINYYSINQRIDSAEVDDEDYGEYEDDELYSILVNGSVFNINLECDNDNSNLNLRSLVIEFDDGATIILDVNETQITMVK